MALLSSGDLALLRNPVRTPARTHRRNPYVPGRGGHSSSAENRGCDPSVGGHSSRSGSRSSCCTPRRDGYYGLPSDRGEGFKIGRYHLHTRPVPDPDRLDRECSPEDEAAVREGVAAYFPEANGPTRRMVASMFTNSSDEHFILDRHPAMDDAFVAAGFSGHGYKFCRMIGRIMADFCLGEEERFG